MPSSSRRALLASLCAATVGGLSGCAALSDRSPPAGTLRFVNDHDLPHSIRLAVTGVGSEPGDEPGSVTGDVIVPPEQRELTASTVVAPGERETYEGVFTEPVWYGIQFEVDGETPENDAGTTVFNPAADGEWRILVGRVYESGTLSWVVSSTDNPGAFEG
jgi:hypothetical protein